MGREDGATAVTPWVSDGNERARRCYARLGFLPTGARRPLEREPRTGQELLRRQLAAVA